MFKKILIVGIVLIVLAGGGFLLWRLINPQPNDSGAATASADIVNDLTSNNSTAGYAMFTDTLKSKYSQDYWAQTFFPQFKGLKTQPKLVSSGKITADASKPAAYPVNTPSWQFVYQLQINNLDYTLTVVAVQVDGSWKINELYGNYKASQ